MQSVNIQWIVLFALPVIMAVSIAHAMDTYVGNVQSYSQNGNQIQFNCDNSVKVRLSICTDDMLRVQMTSQSQFRPDEPYMVIAYDWPAATYSLTDHGGYYTIQTSRLNIRVSKSPLRISYFDTGSNLVLSERAVGGMYYDTDGGGNGCYFDLDPDDHFYGFGQRYNHMDMRGQEVESINYDGGVSGVFWGHPQNHTYMGYPFFCSTRGYGIFYHTTYISMCDMGNASNDWYRFYANDAPWELDYYFIYGPELKRIVTRYTDLTGRSPMPPKWALGFWQSRDSYGNRNDATNVCNTLRSKNLPCDVICLDWNGWQTCHTSLEWNTSSWPDPPGMISEWTNGGFKVSLWENPTTHCGNQPPGSIYGCWQWGGYGDWWLTDFTNPTCADGWFDMHKAHYDIGVDVFKTDGGEGHVVGPYYNGMDAAEMRNLYPQLYNASMFTKTQAYTSRRGLVWGRSGYAGRQRYPALWSGDSFPIFSHIPYHIRAGQNCGLSGFSYWSNDIGGYVHNPSAGLTITPQVYIRWAQFGLLCPLSRAHGQSPREPYAFGSEVETIWRVYANLRYRLLPYLYSYAWDTHTTGLPVMRAMVLEYQDDPNAWLHELQYCFGRELLIAPVYIENATTRDVYLPEGNWYYWWDNQKYTGPQTVTISTPLDTMPIFVKGGSIIPMGPLMQYVDQIPTDPITLNVWPDVNQAATFTLYEDDGLSLDYESGAYCITALSCQAMPSEIRIDLSARQGSYQPQARNYVFKVYTETTPISASNNGVPLSPCSDLECLNNTTQSWFYDEAENWCYLNVPDTTTTSQAMNVTIEFESPPDPPSMLIATALSGSSIELTWQDNSSDEDGFVVHRKPYQGTDAWTKIAELGGQSGTGLITYTDTDSLSGLIEYHYRVGSYRD